MNQYLDDIEVMTEAWSTNLKLRNDTQKKTFLSDYVAKAKVIGMQNTVDFLLPCLINVFNSDSCVHPDIYDTHAHLLFGNMGDLIKMLSRPVRKRAQSSKDVDATSSDTDESDCESDGGLLYDPKYGLNAISTILIPKVYTSFFSSERYDD